MKHLRVCRCRASGKQYPVDVRVQLHGGELRVTCANNDFSPGLLGAEHLGPDEVRVDGFLPRVGGADLQHQGVARGPRQRGQALDGAPRLQGKVGAVELGQGLLDQRHPELLPLGLEGGGGGGVWGLFRTRRRRL